MLVYKIIILEKEEMNEILQDYAFYAIKEKKNFIKQSLIKKLIKNGLEKNTKIK
jgi:hypothetical protein